MSSQAYQPPTSPNRGLGGNTPAATGGAGGTFNLAGPGGEDNSRPVQYACGDCDSKVVLKRGDAIRCKECGHRVLYKERTTRMVQFEAR